MKEIKANNFWNNVDITLRKRRQTYRAMCQDTGITYSSINTQRTRESIPKVEQVYLMAQFLGVSMEYLLTGEVTSFNPPAKLQALVDVLVEDETKLDAVCTLLHVTTEEDGAYGKMAN